MAMRFGGGMSPVDSLAISGAELSRASWFSGRCEASFPETALLAPPHHEGLGFRSGKNRPPEGTPKAATHIRNAFGCTKL
jgi:hypothetical protein